MGILSGEPDGGMNPGGAGAERRSGGPIADAIPFPSVWRARRGCGCLRGMFDPVLGRFAPCAPGWSLVPACRQLACGEAAAAIVAGDPS
jgi:hypothetical protein